MTDEIDRAVARLASLPAPKREMLCACTDACAKDAEIARLRRSMVIWRRKAISRSAWIENAMSIAEDHRFD